MTLQTGYKVSVRVASAIFTKFIGVLSRYAPVTAPNPRDLRKVLCFLSDPQNGLYYRLWEGLKVSENGLSFEGEDKVENIRDPRTLIINYPKKTYMKQEYSP